MRIAEKFQCIESHAKSCHMAKMLHFSLAIHFLAVATPSFAQVAPNERALQYLNSQSHKKLITKTGLFYDRDIFDRKEICQTGYKWDPVSFAVLQPLIFQEGIEHPEAGAWTYRFTFIRCSESTVYNVLFQGQNGKEPRPAMMVPGLTKTSPQLASDLVRGLGSAAATAGVQADCKSVRVLNSKVTVEPFRLETDGRIHEGVWEEHWTARACGKDFSADFCLIPKVTGGTDWSVSKCRRP